MDNHQTKHVISISILLSAIIISNPTLASNGCDFPAIFNFGDSNSDTGGLSASIMETLSPFGMTFFKRPAGRFSDGRLIIDFIAQSIGLPFLHAYLDSLRANFSNGANFATAASTIRLPNTTIFQGGVSPFSLDVQWWQFTQFKSRSQLDYNQEGVFKELVPKKDYFSRALYTFDIGQNDLTAVNFLNMTKEEVATGITAILSDFTAVVKNVYGEGARSFWIHNTGPIGCLAYVLDPTPFTDAQIDDAGCAIPWNELAQHFNKKLNETIVQLRMDLPLAAFTYVDVYSVKYTLFSKAEKLGFKHPLIVCCGRGGKYNYSSSSRCGSTVVVNGTASIVGACNDPSVRINWDGVHYTEAANKWVFDQIVDGAFSDPPIPLKMACRKVAH
ncbi:GDSL esterase/lipase At3g26430-like [Magnolia sinica]|uniref:GDSL esterase/lipase At3g26430-like n=1 Tax=Magnolia sinica TaxID=86752 RepID=UPI00265909CD|nr:GDSL esterase/lipase At3g26430-like [Magnolia sinica]